MAKLSITFFIIALAFCVLQRSTALRIARDAEEPAAGTSTKDGDNIPKALEEQIDKLKNILQTGLKAEHFENFGRDLKSFVDQLGTKSQELFAHADAAVKKLQQEKEAAETKQ